MEGSKRVGGREEEEGRRDGLCVTADSEGDQGGVWRR